MYTQNKGRCRFLYPSLPSDSLSHGASKEVVVEVLIYSMSEAGDIIILAYEVCVI